jgi:hypothetical protein
MMLRSAVRPVVQSQCEDCRHRARYPQQYDGRVSALGFDWNRNCPGCTQWLDACDDADHNEALEIARLDTWISAGCP